MGLSGRILRPGELDAEYAALGVTRQRCPRCDRPSLGSPGTVLAGCGCGWRLQDGPLDEKKR